MVLRDAVDKHEAPSRSQPDKQHDDNEDEANQNADACDEKRMRNLAECLIHLLHLFASVISVIETATTATEIREPRGKPNDEPFFQIERMKQDLLRQFERFTKRPENFDSRLASIHVRHSERISRV